VDTLIEIFYIIIPND